MGTLHIYVYMNTLLISHARGMSMTQDSVRIGRGRRPANAVRDAALGAASVLLFDQGVDAVTYKGVSDLGGVSRTTLKSWWPSPASLAAEAFFLGSEESLEPTDSGDIGKDLREQLEQFVALMTQTPAGSVLRGLIAAAQSDAGVRSAFAEGFVRPRRRIGGKALERAQERGQLHTEVEVQVVVDQIWGACYWRLLTEPDQVDERYLDALVTQALRGAGYAGPFRPGLRRGR
jgi:Tetracyclin repressor-like, C-terminal domain